MVFISPQKLLLFLTWSLYVVFPYITCCPFFLSQKDLSVSHEYICQLADSDRIEKLMRDLFDKGLEYREGLFG